MNPKGLGWRSIMTGRDVLKKGLGWVVGNGESINVWTDPWLSCSRPEVPIGPPPENALSLKVSSLLCPLSNTWNLDDIRKHIPQYEDHVRKLITSSAPAEDQLVWIPDPSGNYTTKTGYGIACSFETTTTRLPPTFDWLKHIWNLHTSPKIKDFLWKVINKAIPVSSNLAYRGVRPFPCKRCGGTEDDLHVFRTCPFAIEVWDLAPIALLPNFNTTSLATILIDSSKMTPLPPVGLSVPLWPWVLWNIWKTRNKLCFDDRFFSAMEVIQKSILDAKEWQAAQEMNSAAQQPHTNTPAAPISLPHRITGAACWVDAAWNQTTGNCGIGGIFKGDIFPPLPTISFAQRSISSALMAEAIAVRSAVMKAASSNIRSLTVLSDSKVIISIVKAKESRPALFGILFDIYHFSSVFENISFVYVPRLENSEADSVAKSLLALVDNPSSLEE